ncbi:hypothetical protein Tco_1530571 [Tanacetum coccineum]
MARRLIWLSLQHEAKTVISRELEGRSSFMEVVRAEDEIQANLVHAFSDSEDEKKTVSVPTATNDKSQFFKTGKKQYRRSVRYAEMYRSQRLRGKPKELEWSESNQLGDSGCSRPCWKIAIFQDFKDFDGGYVYFVEEQMRKKSLVKWLKGSLSNVSAGIQGVSESSTFSQQDQDCIVIHSGRMLNFDDASLKSVDDTQLQDQRWTHDDCSFLG